jgi:branched-chain amino acid transport system permease protein
MTVPAAAEPLSGAGAAGGGGVPPAPMRFRRVPAWPLLFVVVAVFAVFPLVFSDVTTTSIAVYTLIFMVSASAWNIFSGYSGYLALGHAVFFGTGAYTVALTEQDWHVPAGWAVFALMPVAGLVAGLLAIPIGLVALRTRRHTFVVVTIAIFFVFQLLAFNLPFTAGTTGIQLNTPTWSAYTYNEPFFYVTLVILIGTVALSWAVRRSRFGLQLMAIRDDEDRALGMGVRVRRVKLGAFMLSAIPVGMAGGMYAYFLGAIYPQVAFDPLFDIAIALMAFLGGLGTLAGPLIGALVLESLQQYFTLTFTNSSLYLIVYGVLFLVVILLLPRGIVPSLGQLWAWRRARAARGGGADAAVGADVAEVSG